MLDRRPALLAVREHLAHTRDDFGPDRFHVLSVRPESWLDDDVRDEWAGAQDCICDPESSVSRYRQWDNTGVSVLVNVHKRTLCRSLPSAPFQRASDVPHPKVACRLRFLSPACVP